MPSVETLPTEIVRLIFEEINILGPKKQKTYGNNRRKTRSRALENSQVGLLGSHDLLKDSEGNVDVTFFKAMQVCQRWRVVGYEVVFKENASDWTREIRNKREGHFRSWQIAVVRQARLWVSFNQRMKEERQWFLERQQHGDDCQSVLEGRLCKFAIERSIAILEFRFGNILDMAHDVSCAVSAFDEKLRLKIEALEMKHG